MRLVYVADISGMPALVTRMFALPKMRELPFPIALVREDAHLAQVADIPRALRVLDTLLTSTGGARAADAFEARVEAGVAALAGASLRRRRRAGKILA